MGILFPGPFRVFRRNLYRACASGRDFRAYLEIAMPPERRSSRGWATSIFDPENRSVTRRRIASFRSQHTRRNSAWSGSIPSVSLLVNFWNLSISEGLSRDRSADRRPDTLEL